MKKSLSLLIICCLSIVIYSNTFDASFHFDDELSIVSNLSIRNLTNLGKVWNFWPMRFITYITIALNYQIHKFNVFGYHLVNLLIHTAQAAMVFWFVILTFSTPKIKHEKIAVHANLIAFFASAVYLTHPIQTQSVTYIIQRTTSLASLFYLACLNLYIKSRLLQHEKESLAVWKFYYFGSIILAVMAMFTKEMTITLPLMLLLFEYYFLKTKDNINWKQLAPFLITLLIIPLVMLLSKSVNFQEMRLASEPPPDISRWHYFLTQGRVLVTYLRLTLLPINQNLDYDYPKAQALLELPTLASILFLCAILLMALRIFSKQRLLSFTIFWFFLTLAPESSIIPIKDVIFEHRLYLPMVGFSLMLVVVLYYFFARFGLRLFVVALTVIISCYCVLTYNRNFVWKDEFSLWADAIAKSPRKARCYSERGNAYKNRGNLNEAISDYSKAMEIDPNYAAAYNNRGAAYLKKGNAEQALFDCNKAIQLNPKVSFYYYNRANVYKSKGYFQQAVSDYSKAIAINPDFALAYHNRGSVYQERGSLNEAVSDYSKAIAIEPNLALTYYNRGNVYLANGDLIKAVSDYGRAIQIEPNLAGAYLNRAKAHFLKQEYQESWQDVYKLKTLGYDAEFDFLDELKKVSGRQN
jgi:tetratricopeptide (TPR) repeat protein